MLALLAANFLPLLGVLIFRWDVFPLMLLFWFENVVIGVFNAIKMALTEPEDGAFGIAKIFTIGFFCVHYGMFTLTHGFFVVALFGGRLNQVPDAAVVWELVRDRGLMWACMGLVASHGVSFVDNYLRKGEYRAANLHKLMGQPYGRIVVLHVSILAGGFLMTLLKSPVWGLLMLILLKIGLDLKSHLNERRKYSPIRS